MRSKTLALLSIILWSTTLVQAETKLKIVSTLPRTGSANSQTTSIVNGIKLALQESGYKAGDAKIEYEDWDDASPARGNWDPAVEATNADKAIQDPAVVAVIGPYNSGAAKIAMPKLNQAGLLLISPGATWPGLTKPGVGEANEPQVYRPSGKVNFYRVVPADDLQGAAAAKWAKDLGAKSIFMLHDGELYGKGIAGVLKKELSKNGITDLGTDKFDPKASNYRSLAVRIKQLKPDLIFIGATTQNNAGQLAKDLHAAGVGSKIMVPDGCFETPFLEAAGKEALEGKTYVTFGGVPPNQLTGKGKVFYETFKKTFGFEPEGYAAYGYESAKVVLAAIERAKIKDRPGILASIGETKDYDGVLGKWSFDENGDTTLKTMSGSEVKNGAFVFSRLLN